MTDEAVPPKGWHVVVTLSDGTVIRPDILEEPGWTPSINGKPRASVPVRKDADRWLDSRVDDASAKVWLDGERLPIDSLASVDTDARGSTTLRLTGGGELDKRVEKDVDNQQTHSVAEDLVDNNTTYTSDVDTPDTDPIEDQIQQDADTTSEFDTAFPSIGDETPVDSGGDELTQLQTSFFTPTEDGGGNNFDETDGDADRGDYKALLGSGQDFGTAFSPGYTIPSGDCNIATRFKLEDGAVNNGDQTTMHLSVKLDGTEVDNIRLNSNWEGQWQWSEGTANFDVDDSLHTIGISPSEHFDNTTSSDPGWAVDVTVAIDTRVPYTLDNSPAGSPPQLKTPAPFSTGVTVDSKTLVQPLGVDEADIDITTNSTANGQALGVSTDNGSTFSTQSNTDTATFSFGSSESDLTARLTLSGHGTQSTSPTERPNAQTVSEYELRADLSNIPRTINQGFDVDLIAILQDLADDGHIWEVQWDNGITIAWTTPGQRTSGDELDPSDYQVTRDPSQIVEAATVVGTRKSVTDESQTVSSLGTAIDLDHSRILSGTEEIEGTETYNSAVDYTLQPQAGKLVPLEAGDIGDSETLTIGYEYKVEGRYESGAWGNDAATDYKVDIPRIPTSDACEQAAITLVERASDARLEATVDLSAIEPTQSVIESLAIAGLPEGIQEWDVRSIERGQRPRIQLGIGETVQESIEVIKKSIGRLESRT